MCRYKKYLSVTLLAVTLGISLAGAAAEAADRRSDIYSGNPVVAIVKAASPAVVNIDVETMSRTSVLPMPFDDPFFKQFFGEEFRRFSRAVPMKGRGSGFVVSKDGQILTNNHVVDGADKITVTLSDGKTYDATILGKDPTFDLAVIKIKPEGDLPTLELGDSDVTEVGEWVIAIGNPLGLQHSVTVGVVSAKNRSIHTQNINFDGFLQTDAAINPGNSGGPLLDMDGKVVGINTAIVPYAQGLGFAIPVNMARQIMDDLVAYGRVKRGWLGVSVQNMTKEFSEMFKVEQEGGVLVGDVFADSAAEKAGLQVGDVIVAVNGKAVKDVHAFVNTVRSHAPGAELKMKVIREGKTLDLKARLDTIPDSDGDSPPVSDPEEEDGSDVLSSVGIRVSKLTQDLKQQLKSRLTQKLKRQLKTETSAGLIIVDVAEGSPAQLAGIREGDLLIQVNGKKVSEPGDIAKITGKDSKSLVLLIEREERTFFVSLKVN